MYEIAESVLSVFHSQAKANTPQNTKCAQMYFGFFLFLFFFNLFENNFPLFICPFGVFFLFFGVIIYFRNVASVFHDFFFSLNARSWFVELRIVCEPCTPYNSNWFLLLFEKKNGKKVRVVSLFSWTTTKYHNMHVTKKINSQSLLLFLP